MSIAHEGQVFDFDLSDLTDGDDAEIRKVTGGVSLHDIFAGGKVSLLTLGAVIWRLRVRAGETDLEFAEFLPRVTGDSIETQDRKIDRLRRKGRRRG